MKKHDVFRAKSNLTGEEVIKIAKRIIKDETVLIRMEKRRKTEIEKRARRAGLSMSAYLLAAEDKYANSNLK